MLLRLLLLTVGWSLAIEFRRIFRMPLKASQSCDRRRVMEYDNLAWLELTPLNEYSLDNHRRSWIISRRR